MAEFDSDPTTAALIVGNLLALATDPATAAARLSRFVELEGNAAALDTANAEKRAAIDEHKDDVTRELASAKATIEGRRNRIEQRLGRIEDIEATLRQDETDWRDIKPPGDAPYAATLREELRSLQ
jgi:hypothetical protein